MATWIEDFLTKFCGKNLEEAEEVLKVELNKLKDPGFTIKEVWLRGCDDEICLSVTLGKPSYGDRPYINLDQLNKIGEVIDSALNSIGLGVWKTISVLAGGVEGNYTITLDGIVNRPIVCSLLDEWARRKEMM